MWAPTTAMAMAHALRESGTDPRVTVIQSGPQVSGMGEAARRRVLAAMDRLGIAVRADLHSEPLP